MNFLKKTFGGLFKNTPYRASAQDLYWQIVAVSRNPKLYKKFTIPDTLDGRFDCLMVHLFLVIRHLKSLSEHEIATHLLNFFVKDMDRSLRETGVGDPSISRKMRKIGEAYLGRMNAYGVAMDNPKQLQDTLYKNIYRHANDIPENNMRLLTDYVLSYAESLRHFTIGQELPDMTLDSIPDSIKEPL